MQLQQIILKKLEDLKAKATTTMDVSKLSDHFNFMIITTGTSSRHVQSIADYLVEELKKEGLIKKTRVEKDADMQWILIDLGSTVVHVMQQETRDFYDLEKLWSVTHLPVREV
jgi:ribosome-associated protein